MLYFAKFRDVEAAGFVVDAADPVAAADMVVELCGEEPAHLVPLPPGLFAAEVRIADPKEDDEDDEDDEPGNPANVTTSGIALDPFEGLAEWLDAADAIDPDAETASTLPAPSEEDEDAG